MLKTYFCQITADRWFENEENIRNAYDFVDKFIIVEDGTTDGTIQGLNDIANEHGDRAISILEDEIKVLPDYIDNKVKIIIVTAPWKDDFPAQRQLYVDVVSEIRDVLENSWLVVCDTDEFISNRLLYKLKNAISAADQNGFDMLGVQCRSIEVGQEDRGLDDYHKGMIYKWCHGLKIVSVRPDGGRGHLHEGFNRNFRKLDLPNNLERGKEFEVSYRHVKHPGVVWERAQRNFFIEGGGPNLAEKQPLWVPFRSLLEKIMPNQPRTYKDYLNYLKGGEIDESLKSWFIVHMCEGIQDKPEQWLNYIKREGLTQDNSAESSLGWNYDGSSEVREGYKFYFRHLHPAQEPKELTGLQIP